jgi:ribosomal protein S1
MRTFIFLMLFSALFLANESRAGEVRAIELTDGSIVTGEVVSLSNGKYTVHSGSLGSVQIEESKILAIRPVAASAVANSGTVHDMAVDVKTLQDRMMNDQEVMSRIQSLQNDPEFMKIIEDPEIMKAVNAGDISALMANPRFLRLMNNSTVRDIAQKVR